MPMSLPLVRYQDNPDCGLCCFSAAPSAAALAPERGLARLCSRALPSLKEPPNTASLHPQAEGDKMSHLKDKIRNRRSLSLAFPACHFRSFRLYQNEIPRPREDTVHTFSPSSPTQKQGRIWFVGCQCSGQFSFLAAQQLETFLCWENTEFCKYWGDERRRSQMLPLSPRALCQRADMRQ